MPILQTEFICPNSHSFVANAKIRARCPTCGQMARKDFSKPAAPVTAEPAKTEGPVLLKQGKTMPRKMLKPKPPASVRKPLDKGATRAGAVNRGAVQKVSGGTVKMRSKLPKGSTPRVTKVPSKTAIARHITGQQSRGVVGEIKSYTDQMIARALGRG